MSILKVSLESGFELQTLQRSYVRSFELTDYSNNGTLILAAGRSEEIGGNMYYVTGGNYTITDSASNGAAYVYVDENGDGTADAELLNTVPTYDSNKGGWYSGAKKAIFSCVKSAGPIYSQKAKILDDYNIITNIVQSPTIYTNTIYNYSGSTGVDVDSLNISSGKLAKSCLQGFWKATTQSMGSWYTDWSPYVPNIGDWAVVHGARDYTATPKLIYAITRTSTTRIVMYYQNSPTTVGSENYDSGSGTNRTLATAL